MKLSKVKVESFKKVKEAELDLADVNILVGSNSSGKSSIIQALHLATCLLRQVERVAIDKTSTVGIDALDYLPTEYYKSLGHNADWGNRDGTPSSKVAFTFDNGVSASCEIRSARNAGLSITGTVPAALTPLLRAKQTFFSAYIPGISGIPNREEKKSRKVVLRSCSYGDSNVILRNALLLLSLQPENISKIEEWISNIIGNIRIRVSHSDDQDLFIRCNVEVDAVEKPIELVGTGYIQLIQIFSYILLFSPGVLLIDEPDIHLHPTVQEKLVQVLSRVASERGLRVLMTTHSPFVVRGAPSSVNVYWMRDGSIEVGDRKAVELALGWGAFGKRIIIFSEDTELSFLRWLIAQWPEIEKFVTFYPGNGFKNLVTPKQAREVSDALGGKFKILIHRDRDSLIDGEVRSLTKQYADEGVSAWFPDISDIEAFFCSAQFIAFLAKCDLAAAEKYISDVLQAKQNEIKVQFEKQRKAHNSELYPDGGSPKNEDVWKTLEAGPLKGAKGKYLFRQLKNKVPHNSFSEEKILAAQKGPELALSLKAVLESLLG